MVPLLIHDEDVDVLQDIQYFPAFIAFYEAERGRISFPLDWETTLTVKCERTYRAEADIDEHVIRLSGWPTTLLHAYIVAHEITHFLVYAEGYPVVIYSAVKQDETLDGISAALSSILNDVIVDRRLHNYFDLPALAEEYDKPFAKCRAQEPPFQGNEDERLWQIFWYINCGLRYEVDTKSSQAAPSLKVYAEKNPAIAQEANKLIEIIRAMGYDTLEQQKRVLAYVLKRYNLERYGFQMCFV